MRLLTGMFTPAMRATRPSSPLPLLVARVRADHEHDAAPPDHPAALTHRLHGRSNLHPILAGRIQSTSEKARQPHESGPRAHELGHYGRRTMVAGRPFPAGATAIACGSRHRGRRVKDFG